MMSEDEIFLLRLEAKLEREQFKARAQPSTPFAAARSTA